MKFQVSAAPSDAGPIRERNCPSHGSLKRERGVGDLRDASPRGRLIGDKKRATDDLNCLQAGTTSRREENGKILPIPNPSLALQASLT